MAIFVLECQKALCAFLLSVFSIPASVFRLSTIPRFKKSSLLRRTTPKEIETDREHAIRGEEKLLLLLSLCSPLFALFAKFPKCSGLLVTARNSRALPMRTTNSKIPRAWLKSYRLLSNRKHRSNASRTCWYMRILIAQYFSRSCSLEHLPYDHNEFKAPHAFRKSPRTALKLGKLFIIYDWK